MSNLLEIRLDQIKVDATKTSGNKLLIIANDLRDPKVSFCFPVLKIDSQTIF